MLDVKDSVNRLAWTTEHHFLHIQARHDFMRAWAVQFEMAYTDFRVIQMALQLGGEQYHDLLKRPPMKRCMPMSMPLLLAGWLVLTSSLPIKWRTIKQLSKRC